jgi:hypothetical protein
MALAKPILFNSGKVRNNPTRSDSGQWEVTVGGFTEQFDIAVTPRRFRARLHGYHFSKTTYDYDAGVFYTSAPHIWLYDHDASAGYIGWLNSGDPVRYEDIETLRYDALTLLNSICPTGYSFNLQDGDAVYEGQHDNVLLGGVLPWILGWGWLDADFAQEQIADCQLTPGLVPALKPWLHTSTDPKRERNTDVPMWAKPYSMLGSVIFSDTVSETFPNGEKDAPISLKPFVRATRSDIVYTANMNWLKNKSEFAYFYQCDLSTVTFSEALDGREMLPVPKDNDGNYRLYLNRNNDVEVRVGDKLCFSRSDQLHFWVVATGTGTNGVEYITVKDKDPEGEYVNDKIRYLPHSFGWCTGFADAFENDEMWTGQLDMVLIANNDQEEISSVKSMITDANYSDPNEIIDDRKSENKNLRKLLGEFLGDHTQDAGLPHSIVQSTFWNCFTRESGSRELLDLAALERIVKNFGARDVRYKLTIDFGDDETDVEEQNVNVWQILHGVCMTYGARMAWRYSETRRAWFVTFVPYFGESIAAVVTGARVLTDDDFVRPFVSGVAPGTWRYGALSATYETTDGGEVTFNEKMRDGRTVAAASAEALEISDAITLLPPDREIQNLFARRFADYMREFTQEVHTHKAVLAMRKMAMIPVGMGIALDSDYLTTRDTGRVVSGKQYALVTSVQCKIHKDPSLSVEMQTTDFVRRGIGPAFFCTSAQVTNTFGILTISGCTAIGLPTPAGYASGLPIMGYFGCWDFDEADGTIKKRTCSCANYAVTIWQRNTQTVTKAGASRNCWDGVLMQPTLTNVNNGTCTISLAGGDDTNFDTIKATNKGFIVKFAAVDNSAMQPCQLAYFGHFGSSAATLSTYGGGSTVTPILIGG